MHKIEIVKYRERIVHLSQAFFNSRGFAQVFPTRITNLSGACEDFSTLMKLDYYGKETYLSQTSQPLLETYLSSFSKVFSITPCFRKETIASQRHLTEFYHIEAEMLSDSIEEITDLVSEYLNYLYLELGTFTDKADFHHLKYEEASTLLNSLGVSHSYGDDFSSKSEKLIASYANKPVFVKSYPADLKLFNFKLLENGEALCSDLLVKNVGELLGLGIREKDYRVIEERIKSQHTDENLLEDYKWYVDMKRQLNKYSGGFGVGLERLMMHIFDIEDISQTTEFPRNISTEFNP